MNGLVAKELVLVGGGHSHVHVLKMFLMQPMPGVRVTLVAKDVHTPYSGMLPGHVAGLYSWSECHVDLRPLCRRAGTRLVHAAAVGLDLDNKRVLLEGDRPSLPYDVLSIDVGITPDMNEALGADVHAVPVKPIQGFGERLRRLVARACVAQGAFTVVTVGGGAGGVELTLAMKHRLEKELAAVGKPPEWAQFCLVTRGQVLSSHNTSVRRIFREVLRKEGVRLVEGKRVVGVTESTVTLEGGTVVEAEECVWCTQANAQAWLAEAGLDTDNSFIRVNPTLESTSHKGVFAAGDVASVVGYPRPKAGVFAVRQGPPLTKNLRRALKGETLKPFAPQKQFLGLISTGGRSAVLSWGSLGFGGNTALGRRLWDWKDSLDRTWMEKYTDLPEMDGMGSDMSPEEQRRRQEQLAAVAGPEALEALKKAPMRCGGCGAKVGATVLERVLRKIDIPTRSEIVQGAGDDAAVVNVPPGMVSVQTVDYFRAFVDDPYVFGEVAAVHALGDAWAMGADPHAALAIATVPFGLESVVEEELTQMMAGAAAALRAAGCALAGGHSSEGAELSLGFSVHGVADPAMLLRKGGLKPGQVIVVTKPIGTGALFAADMRGFAQGRWVSAALKSMRQQSGPAAKCLIRHGATACTDVTGFGFLGHLVEMVNAAEVRARVDIEHLPLLDGALECVERGITSSLQPQNVRLGRAVANHSAVSSHPRFPLLFDPQTAGGMLAGVPKEAAAACVAELRALGYEQTMIVGEVSEGFGDLACGPPITIATDDLVDSHSL